jgi:hypothetical protein
MAPSKKPIHVLRGIYRLLKTPNLSESLTENAISKGLVQAGSKRRSNASTAYLMQQYRLSLAATTASGGGGSSSNKAGDHTVSELRQRALDFYNLKADLAKRAELLKLDTGADQVLTPRELSRRAAARAGLQLPELVEHVEKRAR